MFLNEDYVPSTFDEAVTLLVAGLDEEEIAYIKEHEYAVVSAGHFSIGRHVRNAWSLWQAGTPFDRDFRTRFGLSHGDDKSGLLFTALVARVLEDDEALRLEDRARGYREHWLAFGLDPETLEKL